jgi:lipopolysaccharide/colanic/teichoic acid biosynthesis glycosyltransferase
LVGLPVTALPCVPVAVAIKAGSPGPVNGRRQPVYEHLDDAAYYVNHCSLRLDLWIILGALMAVVSGEGAV